MHSCCPTENAVSQSPEHLSPPAATPQAPSTQESAVLALMLITILSVGDADDACNKQENVAKIGGRPNLTQLQ